MEQKEKYVKVSWSRLQRLLKKEEKLEALENLGVDSWDRYVYQWDEDEIGFRRTESDEEWDRIIKANYEVLE